LHLAEQLTAEGGWNVETTFILEIASTREDQLGNFLLALVSSVRLGGGSGVSAPRSGGKTSDGDRRNDCGLLAAHWLRKIRYTLMRTHDFDSPSAHNSKSFIRFIAFQDVMPVFSIGATHADFNGT